MKTFKKISGSLSMVGFLALMCWAIMMGASPEINSGAVHGMPVHNEYVSDVQNVQAQYTGIAYNQIVRVAATKKRSDSTFAITSTVPYSVVGYSFTDTTGLTGYTSTATRKDKMVLGSDFVTVLLADSNLVRFFKTDIEKNLLKEKTGPVPGYFSTEDLHPAGTTSYIKYWRLLGTTDTTAARLGNTGVNGTLYFYLQKYSN